MGLWQTIKDWFGGSAEAADASAAGDATGSATAGDPFEGTVDATDDSAGGRFGDATDVADVTGTSWETSPSDDEDEDEGH